jgi:hypothetical protein
VLASDALGDEAALVVHDAFDGYRQAEDRGLERDGEVLLDHVEKAHVNRAVSCLWELPGAGEGHGKAKRRLGIAISLRFLMYNQAGNRHQCCGGSDVADDG